MTIVRLLLLAGLLITPITAYAQCKGAGGINTVDDCPAAVDPQATDVLLGYQHGQSPSTRKVENSQVTNSGFPGSFSPLAISDGAGHLGGATITFPTFAALKAFNPSALTNETTAVTSGHTVAGDGGSATYAWSAASTATNDDILTVQPTGVTTGRWLFQYPEDGIHPEVAGAVGDYAVVGSTGANLSWTGTDNTTAFTALFTALGQVGLKGGKVVLRAGKFYLFNTGDITTPNGVQVTCPTAPNILRSPSGGLITCGLVHDAAHQLKVGRSSQLGPINVLDVGMSPNGPTSWRDYKLYEDTVFANGGRVLSAVSNNDGTGCVAGEAGTLSEGAGKLAVLQILGTNASTTSSISTTTLTVTNVASGTLAPGQTIAGTSVTLGTTIVAQLPTVSFTADINGGIMTVSGGISGGSLAVGQTVTGAQVPSGVTIMAQFSGTTGGVGIYFVSGSTLVGSRTLGSFVPGGVGTYTVSASQTVGSRAITSSPSIYSVPDEGGYLTFPPATGAVFTPSSRTSSCVGATVNPSFSSGVASVGASLSATGATMTMVRTVGFTYGVMTTGAGRFVMDSVYTSAAANGIYLTNVSDPGPMRDLKVQSYWNGNIASSQTGLVGAGTIISTGAACTVGKVLKADPAAGTFTVQSTVVVTTCSGTTITGISTLNADGAETGNYTVSPRNNTETTPLAFTSDDATNAITAIVYYPVKGTNWFQGVGVGFENQCDGCNSSLVVVSGGAIGIHVRNVGVGFSGHDWSVEPNIPPPGSGPYTVRGASGTALQTDDFVEGALEGGHFNGALGGVRLLHTNRLDALIPETTGGIPGWRMSNVQIGQSGRAYDSQLVEIGPGSTGVLTGIVTGGSSTSIPPVFVDASAGSWFLDNWIISNSINSSVPGTTWIDIDPTSLPTVIWSNISVKYNSTATPVAAVSPWSNGFSLNVQNYGSPTDVTDWTAAFQRADDAGAAAGGRWITVPAGTYTVNGAVTQSLKNQWIINPSQVTLTGTGTLGGQALLDYGPTINQGGGCRTLHPNGNQHSLIWSDCRADFVTDFMSMQTQDPSLNTAVDPTGVPVAGEKPGLSWDIDSVTYTVKYTVQPGDTNLLVSRGIAACMGPTPGVNCTITGSPPGGTIIGALHALTPRAQYIAGNSTLGNTPAVQSDASILFDVPWGTSSCPTAMSTGGTTLTVSKCTSLDVAPLYTFNRNVPGRTPVGKLDDPYSAGDAIAQIKFVGQSTGTAGGNTVYGNITTRVYQQDNTNPVGMMQLGVANGLNGVQAVPEITIWKGVSSTSCDGATQLSSLGNGQWYLCGLSLSPVGGSLGVGEAYPHAAQLSVGGVYTANPIIARISGTDQSTDIGRHFGLLMSEIMEPMGASVDDVIGVGSYPKLKGSLNVAKVAAVEATIQSDAAYTGTITAAKMFTFNTSTLAGTHTFVTNFAGYTGTAITNGDGTTTGNVNNTVFEAAAATAAAGNGGIIKNYGLHVVMSPAVAAAGGTQTNNGVWITGTGGTGGAGTTTSYAFRSDSPNTSLFAGALLVGSGVTDQGVGTVNPSAGYYIGNVAGVDCAAGALSTLTAVVSKGLVTHC